MMFDADRITRDSPRFPECELTYIERTPIDLNLARIQHANYVAALKALGCKVIELQAEPDLPDSVFVEDTAVVLPGCAIVTFPGALSRRAEINTMPLPCTLRNLNISIPLLLWMAGCTVVGDKIYIGLSHGPTKSDRSNETRLTARIRYRTG
jgi:dimethylargininase